MTALTPCIKVCIVDGLADICLGCGRTLPEIAQWGRLDDVQRAAIMRTLPGRMKAKGIVPPSPPQGATS